MPQDASRLLMAIEHEIGRGGKHKYLAATTFAAIRCAGAFDGSPFACSQPELNTKSAEIRRLSFFSPPLWRGEGADRRMRGTQAEAFVIVRF
jgi:hypothetical protein